MKPKVDRQNPPASKSRPHEEGSFFLNVNKPKGVTSRDVVDVVSKCLRQKRCGHAGTLDPLATGVLVIAVGKATRLIEYVQQMPKTYVARFRLGQVSDTDDIEGNITNRPDVNIPSRETVERALSQFVGTIEQTPPAFSAVKVAGKRAYDLARAGKSADLKPRPVVIHCIDLLTFEYPFLDLRIECGSGTYIRSLARDLGELLQTGALMTDLQRTAIGTFQIDQAIAIDAFKQGGWQQLKRPIHDAVAHLPSITLDEEAAGKFLFGQHVRCDHRQSPGSELATFDEHRRFLGIARATDQATIKAFKAGFV